MNNISSKYYHHASKLLGVKVDPETRCEFLNFDSQSVTCKSALPTGDMFTLKVVNYDEEKQYSYGTALVL